MVTVETAICLGGVLIVLALVLAGLSAVLGQIQCTDAAREAARLVARGETEQARKVAARIAPSGAAVTITITADTVTVSVTAHPMADLLPGVALHAEAYAVREPQPPDDPSSTVTPTTTPAATPATAKGNG